MAANGAALDPTPPPPLSLLSHASANRAAALVSTLWALILGAFIFLGLGVRHQSQSSVDVRTEKDMFPTAATTQRHQLKMFQSQIFQAVLNLKWHIIHTLTNEKNRHFYLSYTQSVIGDPWRPLETLWVWEWMVCLCPDCPMYWGNVPLRPCVYV